jgi:hypothetical protein
MNSTELFLTAIVIWSLWSLAKWAYRTAGQSTEQAPNWTLRLLGLLLVALTLLAINSCGDEEKNRVIDLKGYQDGGITYYRPPKSCPPADGSTWRFEPLSNVADRIIWVEGSFADTNATCGFSEVPPGVTPSKACALSPPIGSDTGIVYTWVPRWAMTESYIQHEECHTVGWVHGPHLPG